MFVILGDVSYTIKAKPLKTLIKGNSKTKRNVFNN